MTWSGPRKHASRGRDLAAIAATREVRRGSCGATWCDVTRVVCLLTVTALVPRDAGCSFLRMTSWIQRRAHIRRKTGSHFDPDRRSLRYEGMYTCCRRYLPKY